MFLERAFQILFICVFWGVLAIEQWVRISSPQLLVLRDMSMWVVVSWLWMKQTIMWVRPTLPDKDLYRVLPMPCPHVSYLVVWAIVLHWNVRTGYTHNDCWQPGIQITPSHQEHHNTVSTYCQNIFFFILYDTQIRSGAIIRRSNITWYFKEHYSDLGTT